MRVLVLAEGPVKDEFVSSVNSASVDLDYYGDIPRDITPPDACIDLQFENTPQRIHALKQLTCPLIAINAVDTTLREIGDNFIRINAWPTLLGKPLLEAAAIQPALQEPAELLFHQLGKKLEWVTDQPGFISCRVISSIINEAFFALAEGVSTEQEIDTAMKLGTNYPYGPFEWAQRIGLQNIYHLLTRLARDEKRYQPCELLAHKALA